MRFSKHSKRQQLKNSGFLTPREKEILELISYGWTINEIADKLFLSVHTIVSHRKHLLSKLDAKNAASLIRLGFESGALTFSSRV